VAAYGLQVVAVSLGPVVIVQPLISCQLVFALLFGVWISGQKAGWQDWAGALAVVAGIALFIAATDPSPGDTHATGLAWAAAAAAVCVPAAGALAAGNRVSGPARSALWGVAAGFLWGLMIVLMKAVTAEFGGPGPAGARIVRLLAEPFVYGVAVSALAGFLFLQSAFQEGSLTSALVSYTVVEIVVAVALGILLFGERPHDDLSGLLLVGLSSVLLLAGIVLLARSPAVSGRACAATSGRPSRVTRCETSGKE